MVRPGRDRLEGVVAADEIYLGGPRSGKRGRGAAGKSLVEGLVQQTRQGRGRIRLARGSDASAARWALAVTQAVAPGRTVRPEAGRGDAGLLALGCQRPVVRAQASVGEHLLPLASRVASLRKRWLWGTPPGAGRPTRLDDSLDEFPFRFNRRSSRPRGLRFDRLVHDRLVQQAVAREPGLTRSLLGGRGPGHKE
jgi:hypothetical protein